LLDEDGDEVHLLDLINEARAARGLGATSRADLRFSQGVNGEVFVLNKHDGILRRLVVVPEPSATMSLVALMTFAIARRRRHQDR
jgi:hypothetical protein